MKKISLGKRFVSVVMGLVMLVNVTAFQTFSDAPDWTGQPDGIKWNENEEFWETDSASGKFGNYEFSAYWDPTQLKTDYYWDATDPDQKDSKEVRIVFTFNNSKDTDRTWRVDSVGLGDTEKFDDYPDIWFDIEGIADARRGEKQEAVVGRNYADFVCDGYEVSPEEGDGGHAVYKLASDIQTLNGGMEIVWDYNPRQMTDGYTKELHPAAYIKVYENSTKYHVVKVNLKPMNFEFHSERDNFTVDINESLQNDFDHGAVDNAYTWKRVATEFSAYAKTRPLQEAVYTVEIPKEDIAAFVTANHDSSYIYDNELDSDDDTIYLKINGEYINFREALKDERITTENIDGKDYYVIELDEDSAFRGLVEFSKSGETHATKEKDWKNANASNVYIGIKNTAIDNRVLESRLGIAKKLSLLPEDATVDEYKTYYNAGAGAIDLNATDSIIRYIKEKIGNFDSLSAEEKQAKISEYIAHVESEINDVLKNALKAKFNTDSDVTWDDLTDELTKADYTFNYKYGCLTGVYEDFNIDLNVQSHIVRRYEETDEDLDADIPHEEQSISEVSDKHLDHAIYSFGDDKYSQKGSLGVEKHIKNYGKNAEPVMNADSFKAGRDITYVIGANVKNMNQPYELVIGDDKLLVMEDDNKTDYSGSFEPIKGQHYRELEAGIYNEELEEYTQKGEYHVKEVYMPKYIPDYQISSGSGVEYTVYGINADGNSREIGSGNTSEEKIITLSEEDIKKVEIVIKSNENGSSISYSPEVTYCITLEDDFRSGRGDNTTKDPYGRLVNFSYSYVRTPQPSGSVNPKGDAIIGLSLKDAEESGYRYYHDEGGNILVYNIYNNQKYNENDNDFVKTGDEENLVVGVEATEYLKTISSTEGEKYIYAYRDDAALRLRDPSVQINESVSYSKKGGYMEEIHKEENGNVEVYYQTDIESKVTITADTGTNLNKLKISTIIPKEFAKNNSNVRLTASNIKTKNIIITEDVNGDWETTELDGKTLYTYINGGSTATMKPLKGANDNDTDYYIYEEEIDFGTNYITIEPDKNAEISFTYPLLLTSANAIQWKQEMDSNVINGAAIAKIETDGINITGNSGLNDIIKNVVYDDDENNIPGDIKNSDTSASTTVKLPVIASVWNEKAVKTVKSTVRGSDAGKNVFGVYAEVNPFVSGVTNADKYAEYTYQLSFTMGNSYAKRIFFYDNLEKMDYAAGNADNKKSKWQGILKSVGVNGGSDSNVGGDNSLKATVYYNVSTFSDLLYQKNSENSSAANITNEQLEPEGNDWTLADRYTGDLSAVKAVCVIVEPKDSSSLIEKGSEIHFTVTMQAPDKATADNNYMGESTYNHFVVRYSRVDSEGNRSSAYAGANPNNPVISDITEVTLKDKMVNLKVVKTEFGKKVVSSNSKKKYMSLSGSEFKVYKINHTGNDIPDTDEIENKQLIKNKIGNSDEFPTDDGGELVLNLEPGWYILEESKAPDGFKLSNEILFRVEYDYSKYSEIYDGLPQGADESDYNEVNSGKYQLKPSLDVSVKIYENGNYIPVDSNSDEQHVFYKWLEQDDTNGAEVDVLQLEVADDIIKGKLVFTKYDKTYNKVSQALTGNEVKTVPNVTYRIVKANGSTVGDRVYVTGSNGNYSYSKSANGATDKVTTDLDGQIIIRELPWGSYFLIEQSAPVGYEVPDSSDKNNYVAFSVPVTDTKGHYVRDPNEEYMLAKVNAEDKEQGYSVRLTKTDEDGNMISNAAFTLQVSPQNADNWQYFDAYSNKLSVNGIVEFVNLDSEPILSQGMKYRIEETHAAASYQLPESVEDRYSPEFDFSYDTAGFTQNSEGTFTKTENDKKTVITVSGDIIVKKVYTADSSETLDYTLTVNKTDNTLRVDVTMTNEKKPPQLTIYKTDEDGVTPLSGARLALYEVVGEQDNVTLTNGVATLTPVDGADKLIMSPQVTDSDGKCLVVPDDPSKTLEWGKTYYIVELKRPKGYLLPNGYTFPPFVLNENTANITLGSPNSSSIPVELHITNEHELGTVTLVKYKGNAYGDKIAITNTNPVRYEVLENAQFKLFDGNGNVVENNDSRYPIKVNGRALDLVTEKYLNESVLVTDADGILKIENLPWGRNYRLVEISSGDNRYDTAEIKKFTVDKNHLIIDKEVVDPIKTASLTIQKEINEWVSAFGDATFIFKVKELETDENGAISIDVDGETYKYAYAGQEFTKMITFNEEDGGSLTDSVKLTNLKANSWYEVSEIPVARYKLQSISGVDNTTIKNEDVSTRKCYVKIADSGSNTVKFVNNLKYYDRFSENATKDNNVEKDLMISGVNFNINTALLNHPETQSLLQTSLSQKTYNFLERTGNDPNSSLVKVDGVYPSDAFEVYVSVDDPNIADKRIYPLGHEKYDSDVGYYEILQTDDVFTDGDTVKTNNNDYVSEGNGIINFPNQEQDVTVKIRVVLPNTSKYTWVSKDEAKHIDSDVLHIETAPVPKPITFKFNLDKWVKNENNTNTLTDINNNETGLITWGENPDSSVPKTLTYRWDVVEEKYELDGTINIPDPKASVSTYNGWFIEDPTNNFSAADSNIENTLNFYLDEANAGKEYNLYPTFIQGRAMFDGDKLKSLTKQNASLTSVQKSVSKTVFDALGGTATDVSYLNYDLGDGTTTNIDVYAKVVNNVLYWYSKDSYPFAPTDMSWLFGECKALTDIEGILFWDTSKTTTMHSCFKDTKLTNVDLSNWDTSSVETFWDIFTSNSDLQTVKMTFNTSGKTNVQTGYMFSGCTKLENIYLNGDFSGVSTAKYMFNHCENLWNLKLNHVSMASGEDSRNYSNVSGNNKAFANCTDMSFMFSFCKKLSSIDMAEWDTSNVTNMDNMFAQLGNNRTDTFVLDVSNLNTSSVTNFKLMFDANTKTSDFVGLHKFNTSSATTFEGMFYNCSAVTKLDLSSFTTTHVTNINNMFYMYNNDNKLTTIYVNSAQWDGTISSDANVFPCTHGSAHMVGGTGVHWSNINVKGDMAKVDEGYFTDYLDPAYKDDFPAGYAYHNSNNP